jgi:hypothetical protein
MQDDPKHSSFLGRSHSKTPLMGFHHNQTTHMHPFVPIVLQCKGHGTWVVTYLLPSYHGLGHRLKLGHLRQRHEVEHIFHIAF